MTFACRRDAGVAECCAGPDRHPSASAQHRGAAVSVPLGRSADPGAAERDEVLIPTTRFAMGDAFDEGYAADGETPVHEVTVSEFRIDATAVTNREFARFVAATGYRTESERFGSSAVFHLQYTGPAAGAMPLAGAEWWLNVPGADWAHPTGPGSDWRELPEHPVVQVSWNDAQAYCHWSDRRLPTEAEWECAARGGLVGRRYAWGDDLLADDGSHHCNIWQGSFPTVNTLDDGHLGTAPVRTFPPNGFGLYEVSGNVWEWCHDWFQPGYYRVSPDVDPQGPAIGPGRVMRGGSFLCHDSYCNRYRVAARSKNTPDSASSNVGFRTVAAHRAAHRPGT